MIMFSRRNKYSIHCLWYYSSPGADLASTGACGLNRSSPPTDAQSIKKRLSPLEICSYKKLEEEKAERLWC